MASHSAAGTEDRSTALLCFWLSSDSQTHVLISYKVGYGCHSDMAAGASILSTRVALTVRYPRSKGRPLHGAPERPENTLLENTLLQRNRLCSRWYIGTRRSTAKTGRTDSP